MRTFSVVLKSGPNMESINVIADDEVEAKREAMRQRSEERPGVGFTVGNVPVLDLGPVPSVQ